MATQTSQMASMINGVTSSIRTTQKLLHPQSEYRDCTASVQGGSGGAGLHDPFRAARAAVAEAESGAAAAKVREEQAKARSRTKRGQMVARAHAEHARAIAAAKEMQRQADVAGIGIDHAVEVDGK